jgi:hypothetical protein
MSDKLLTDICERLDTLEAMVGLGRRSTLPSGLDRRLTKRELAMRRGKSTRTIDRDVKRGVLPEPEVEGGRLYWWLSALQRHERKFKSSPRVSSPAARATEARTTSD